MSVCLSIHPSIQPLFFFVSLPLVPLGYLLKVFSSPRFLDFTQKLIDLHIHTLGFFLLVFFNECVPIHPSIHPTSVLFCLATSCPVGISVEGLFFSSIFGLHTETHRSSHPYSRFLSLSIL